MLKITTPDVEFYDEEKNEFSYIKGRTLRLEHSLISISKWESKWCKPFLEKNEKTNEEIIDYIKCMTLNEVPDEVYKTLSKQNIEDIEKYINSPMTATTINSLNQKNGKREKITSELIYCWMVMLNIPFECEKWHLNRLLMLIQVCNIKNQPPKKMGKKEQLKRYADLNNARKKALNTRG